ncbi:MAG: acyl-ACP--UDP-N-acetylglucosamine O-acyltransferase [Trueperaceae bacterium]|nr:acyl-ACP--UDP-N-acetylglucosamine O-acyltransferase [Trueperaceae bacterium]
MATIHPSAVIDPAARLAADVTVGPFVVIEADVTVGTGTQLLAGTILLNGTRVGAHARLGPYTTVGNEPMDRSFDGERSFAVLEDGVRMFEFASVHRASGENAETRVGANSMVMSYAHVSHNARVGRDCVLTTHAQLAGHSQVGDLAVLGADTGLHQFGRVGTGAMLGASAKALKDVLPYTLASGQPARHYRLNRVGLQRRGVDGERYRRLEQAFRAFRKHDLDRVEALAAESDEVRTMLDFYRSSTRGITRFV